MYKQITKIILAGVLAITINFAQGQGGDPIIMQFSGLVVSGDSLYGLPGIYVYVPKAGRGTMTNQFGFFSMPVLPKDSIVISGLGYQARHLVIQYNEKQSVSVVIKMQEDTILLPIVEIFPYHSEKEFKEAFLSLNLPDETQRGYMQANIDPMLLAKMQRNTNNSANQNYRGMAYDQIYRDQMRFATPSMAFLNPFAWAEVVRSIRRGDLKKKAAFDDDK
ncbi:MAG: carboxypeptidase-like regulatory domain-containing protein [Cytophagales bacterium]|nr:carboxypeptidase-like regulatory domain-containing protein [Cytophagales bacterium]